MHNNINSKILFTTLVLILSLNAVHYKVGDYEYISTDAYGNPLIKHKLLNTIQDNTFMDCDILTCDYKIEIYPYQDIDFNESIIRGHVLGKGATIEKIFFEETETKTEQIPVYSEVDIQICEFNNETQREECRIVRQPQTTLQQVQKTVKKEDTTLNKIINAYTTKTVVIRFKKDQPNRIVDIYHSLYGNEFKDAAWWNISWSYKIPIYINTTAKENLINFPASVLINTSNTTLWNTTHCGNVRFTDATETKVLPYDIESNSSTFCGSTTNLARFYVLGNYSANTTNLIYAYLGNLGAQNGENAPAVWQPAEYVAVYHGGDWSGTQWLDSSGNGRHLSNYYGSGGGTTTIIDNRPFIYANGKSGGGIVYRGGPFSTPAARSNATVSFLMRYISGASYPTFTSLSNSGSYGLNSIYYSGAVRAHDGSAFYANLSGAPSTNLEYYVMQYDASGIFFLQRNLTRANGSGSMYSSATYEYLAVGSVNPVGGYESYGTEAYFSEVRVRSKVSTAEWLAAEYGTRATIGNITSSGNWITPPTPAHLSNLSTNNITFSLTTSFNSANLSIDDYTYPMSCSGASGSFTCNYTTTLLQDGLHTFYALAFNSTNPSEQLPLPSRAFYIDTLAPTNVFLTSPLNMMFYLQNATITLTYNDTLPSTCFFQINTLNVSVPAGSLSCSYQINNSIGNYSVVGYIKDFFNRTSSSQNITFYIFNYSGTVQQTQMPECDLFPDTINASILLTNYFGNISANLSYNGTFYPMQQTGTWVFSSPSILPPAVYNLTNITATFYASLSNTTFSVSYPFNISIQSCGLMSCGGITNTSAFTYTTLNADTLAPIVASGYIILNQSTAFASKSRTISYSGTSQYSVCIFPSTLTINSSSYEIFNATGFYSQIINRLKTQYSNTNTTLNILLINTSSAARLTIFYAKDQNYLPLANAYINIYQFNAPTASYFHITSIPTLSSGTGQAYLIPNNMIYHFNITDTSGNLLQDFADSIVSCGTFDSVCSVILIVGGTSQTPYISTFLAQNASCSYSNSTGYLLCQASGSGITGVNLTIYRLNGTVSSVLCSKTGTNSASCTLPPTKECFNMIFKAKLSDQSEVILLSGQICNYPEKCNIGNIGLIGVFIIVAGFAFIGLYFGASGSCAGAATGLLLSKAIPCLFALDWIYVIPMAFALYIVAYLVR